jgi:hypothetical protein
MVYKINIGGLSGVMETINIIKELQSLNEEILSKFSLVDGQLMFDKKSIPVGGGSTSSDTTTKVFNTYDELKTYASEDTKAYVGQLCAVIDTVNNRVTIYKINIDKTVSVLGGDNGVISISDFLDDAKTRTDRGFSSQKIMNTLLNYALKDSVYNKDENNALFSSKSMEHKHSNMVTLNKLTGDDTDIYYNSKKLLTELKPKTISKQYTNNYTTSTLLIDVNDIFTTNNLNAIIDSEFIIKNNIPSVNTTEDIKDENQLHLIITDNELTILDVVIPPALTEKYLLGISPNIQVFVQGNFTASHVMTAY